MSVMMVSSFLCRCDKCGKKELVLRTLTENYNGAQAVRSLGWSFGKDRSVFCESCRSTRMNDRYRFERK